MKTTFLPGQKGDSGQTFLEFIMLIMLITLITFNVLRITNNIMGKVWVKMVSVIAEQTMNLN